MLNKFASKISTTVRASTDRGSSSHAQEGAHLHSRVLESVPSLAGPLLSQIFLTPGRRFRRQSKRTKFARPLATRIACVNIKGHSIDVFARGKGPVVLLVHGWQSGRERLDPLGEAISASGYTVVTWDMPAHGKSPGRTTSLPQFVEAILTVSKLVGSVHSIVGHSLGATATALALRRGLSVQTAVLVAPMISFDFALDQFQKFLRLSSSLRELTATHTESRVNLRRGEADLLSLPSPSCPVLLIHDEKDERTPLFHSQSLAERWKPEGFMVTKGLGHSRLLADKHVLERVVSFVGEACASGCAWERFFSCAPELRL